MSVDCSRAQVRACTNGFALLPLRLMTLAGAEQPFYHVLVDNRDRPGDESTYVAEENIRVLPCVVRMHPIVLTFLSTAAPAAAG